MHGKGHLTWPNGSYYHGEYYKGLKSGDGVFCWNTYKYYTGQWVDNKQHGVGTLKIKNSIHKGNWRYGNIVKLRKIISAKDSEKVDDKI